MSPEFDSVLVRFGEIGIKSPPVRKRMLDRLQSNLFDLMLHRGVEGNVERMGARLRLVGPDISALLDVATHCFGVVSASPCRQVESDLDTLGAAAAEMALARDGWSSFAIRADRDGEHTYSSKDIGIQVGSAVWKAAEADGRSPRVDLNDPELEIQIDVRGPKAFVFADKHAGPGGLPMGAQGKVVALVSDPASMAAAWLMMRRGCRVIPLHAGTSGSLPFENLEALQGWGLGDKADVLPVCTGFVAKAILLQAAMDLARRIGAQAIVTGDTLDSALVDPDGPVPVLRPVCGLAPAHLKQILDRIGVDDDEPEHIFDDGSHETVESLQSMHRIVEIG